MKKKKVAITLGVLVLIGALAVTVFALQRGGGRMGMMRMMMGMEGCRGGAYADLTEEQRTQLDALWQEFLDDTSDLRDEMGTKAEEFHALMNESDPDPDKVKALQKELWDLAYNIAQRRIDFVLKARKIAPEINYLQGCGKGGFGRHMRGYGPQGGGFGPGAW